MMSNLPSEDELPEEFKSNGEQSAAPRPANSEKTAAATQNLASILWPRRRRLFRWTIVAMVASGVCAFVMPKRWEASATLMPPDQSASSTGALQGMLAARAGQELGAIAGDMLGVRNPSYMLMGILGSETVQRELVDKFDLRKEYNCQLYVDAEKILKKHTDIEEVRLSGMITIRVTDSNPVRARDMVQAYVDAANRLAAQLTTSSAHRERMFLEERLKAIKQDLDNSSLALSQFSSRTRTLNPEAQGRAMLTASADLQGHLIAAEAELRGLQQIYSPDNERVRVASARVAELRGQFNKMAGASDSSTENPSADDSSHALYPSIRELPMLDNTYAELYRKTEIQEAVYEALTKQFEVAKVQEAKEIPSVRLLDPPRVPERKAWPPRALIALLGGMLGFIVAVLSVLGERAYAALDPGDPRRSILTQMTALAPWRSRRSSVANAS